MAQEIITFIIVVFAVGLAVYKSYKKLKRKKSVKLTGGKAKFPATQSVCSGCVADCLLRDLPVKHKNENAQLCERNVEQLKCS